MLKLSYATPTAGRNVTTGILLGNRIDLLRFQINLRSTTSLEHLGSRSHLVGYHQVRAAVPSMILR